MKHEVYIAFDYGLKKTGVAIAQSITKTASPLLSLKMINGEPDWEDIDSIFENFKPNCAIFGMPIKQINESNSLNERINSFSSKIEKRYQISIGFINEHLTSKIAKDKLKDSETDFKRAKNAIDRARNRLKISSRI